jgi:membrane-associated phospholipid phosphatase
MKKRALVLGAAVLATSPDIAAADTELTPLSGLGSNTFDSFIGWPSFFHIAATSSTGVLVQTGPDHDASLYFRDHPGWGAPGIGGELLGYVAPTVGTGLVYLVGRTSHDDKTLVASYALIQSTALTIATVTTLKFFTGRAPPGEVDFESSRDVSHSFRFGLNRGGVWDGWPSGHTALITAMASTLTAYYRSTAVGLVGAAAIAYTGFSMVSYQEGTVHWLSDVVAGFLIALPIGINVGNGFRARLEGQKQTTQSWSLIPMASRGTVGLGVAIAL